MPLTPIEQEAPARTGRLVPVDDPVAALVDPRLAPETQMAQKEAVGVRRGAERERENFVRENADRGVRMDLDAELPAALRARVSFESDLGKQAELIGKEAGILSARPSKDGRNVIVRINDESGNPKDVLLHPKTSTLSMGDVAGATAPLMKGGALAAIAAGTGGLSLPATAGVLGGSAAGLEAVSSGTSRVLADQDIDPKQLALASTKEGAINAALPLAAGAVTSTARGVSNLVRRGAGELERRVPGAASRLGVPSTLAETTGNPTVAKIGRLSKEEETARSGALAASKERAVGSALASEAEIANKVQPIFAQSERAAAAGVRGAMTDAEKAAQAQIQTELDSGLVPTNLTHTEAGKFIRGKIEGVRDAFQAQAQKNYGEVYSMAEKEGIAVPTDAITKLANEIKAKDPHGAIEQIVPEIRRIFSLQGALTGSSTSAKPLAVLDAFGRPIMGADAVEPLTLPQAIELRAVINDKINRGEAVGDIPGRYLKDLAKSLTDAIDSGVKSGSPELQAAFTKAREAYAKDIGKFSTADIGRVFADPDTARALGDDEIIPMLFRGKGNLDALRKVKDVLGADSNEYKLVLRQGVQSIIDEARAGGQMIDAGKFLTRLGGLSDELQSEALGASAKAVRANAALMNRAQGAKLTEEELLDALAAAPGTAPRLIENAIAREEAYERTYNSTVQRQLRDGVLGPRTMGSTDDFLTRFIDGKNTSVADVRQALSQIGAKSPEAVEQIRQRTMQNILDTARAKPPLGKATTGEVEDLNHEKLLEFIRGPAREKYQAVVGQRGIEFLDDLATYAEATAKRQAAEVGRKVTPETLAKEAASGAIGFRRNAIGALVDVSAAAARTLGGGKAIRNPAVRRYLETGELPSFGRTARAMILAAPAGIEAERAVIAEKP